MSKIIKSNFISFADHNRQIPTVDEKDPKIIRNPDIQGDVISQEEHQTVDREQEVSTEVPKEESKAGFDMMTQEEQENLLLEIEAIKEEAMKQGQNEGYETGYMEGKAEGYDQGFTQGVNEGEASLQQKLANSQVELDKTKEQLIHEFESYKTSLEPQMLEIIESLVVKLIGIQEISQGTIMHLIHAGLNELELHGDLVIKVSSFDLDYVYERQDELTEDLSEKVQVEILRDQQLKQNECIIETEMGTIECSLGTQLEGLMKELRLIRESLIK